MKTNIEIQELIEKINFLLSEKNEERMTYSNMDIQSLEDARDMLKGVYSPNKSLSKENIELSTTILQAIMLLYEFLNRINN